MTNSKKSAINRSKPKGNRGNLVLSRHVGESIVINDEIVIMISSIRGNKVGIAVKAPRDVSVVRKELCDKKGKPE